MSTNDKLQGKICIITGSTRGFGLAIARAFLREGATVVINSRNQQALDERLKEFRQSGGSVSGIACDVSVLEQIQNLLTHTLNIWGTLDVWVNNAALSAPYGPTIHVPSDEFLEVTHTNVIGTYYGSLIAMRHFLHNKKGKLINITGVGDRSPRPLQNAYASSKAWVINFTRALAKEYENSGVGVYVQNPGMMETDFLEKVDVIAGYEDRLKLFPMIRRMWSQAPDIPAERTVWLASDATDGRTGLVVKELTFPKIIGGAMSELGRRALNRHQIPVKTEITTVKPAFPLSKEAE